MAHAGNYVSLDKPIPAKFHLIHRKKTGFFVDFSRMAFLWYNTTMEPQEPQPPSELKGFTQTGRDDAAREILKPQRDPAYVKKATALALVVFVAFFVLGYLVFLRSGKTLFSGNTNEKRFEPPPSREP